jgi:hypothetical protein
MNNLPDIDDAYIRRVFDALNTMQVDLDGDPLMFGPKRLNSKVAQCREYLSRCQNIYLQLADDLHKLSRANRQAKLDFDIKSQDLLANDPEVKSQRAIRDREAVVSSKLRVERETNHLIETSITDLESVIMVVKAKREDLKDIQGRIRDQVKLCQEEIALGSKWGSAPPPGASVNLDARPRVDTRALEQLNEVLDGVDGESSITDLANFVRDEMVARGEPAPEAPPRVTTATVGHEVATVGPDDGIDLDDVLENAPGIDVGAGTSTTVVTVAHVEADKVVVDLQESAESFALPVVEEPAPAPASTSSVDEVEDFFNALDDGAPKKGAAPTPPAVDDLDIDDLIGTFG